MGPVTRQAASQLITLLPSLPQLTKAAKDPLSALILLRSTSRGPKLKGILRTTQCSRTDASTKTHHVLGWRPIDRRRPTEALDSTAVQRRYSLTLPTMFSVSRCKVASVPLERQLRRWIMTIALLHWRVVTGLGDRGPRVPYLALCVGGCRHVKTRLSASPRLRGLKTVEWEQCH